MPFETVKSRSVNIKGLSMYIKIMSSARYEQDTDN